MSEEMHRKLSVISICAVAEKLVGAAQALRWELIGPWRGTCATRAAARPCCLYEHETQRSTKSNAYEAEKNSGKGYKNGRRKDTQSSRKKENLQSRGRGGSSHCRQREDHWPG